MKNIQIIDGSLNCSYDIYQATDEEFQFIFPNNGQDIQFIEDIADTKEMRVIFNNIWNRRVDKKESVGIHGTLFYEMEYKKILPNQKESDLDLIKARL